MKSRLTTVLALIAALMMIAAVPAAAGGRPLTADLNGANEIPPGDPDGTGTMLLTLNQGQGEICWVLDATDIAPPTRAHIHAGQAGSNGGIVVGFFDTAAEASFEGCVGGIEKDVMKGIRQNPSNYYINVHNAEFPAGAIRGQLSK